MELTHVIKKSMITEKANRWLEEGKYTFQVAREATKKEIKKAIEKFFKVKVKSVRAMIAKGKERSVGIGRRQTRTTNWKKAIIQLVEGDKIDIFAAPEEGRAKKK